MITNPIRVLTLAAVTAFLIGGCAARSADDRVMVHPDDDVFVAQSPYGADHHVVVLARTDPIIYAGGAFVLTGGREIVVTSPQSWRGYTGQALSAEEAQQRIIRAERAAEASRRLRDAMDGVASSYMSSAKMAADAADAQADLAARKRREADGQAPVKTAIAPPSAPTPIEPHAEPVLTPAPPVDATPEATVEPDAAVPGTDPAAAPGK